MKTSKKRKGRLMEARYMKKFWSLQMSNWKISFVLKYSKLLEMKILEIKIWSNRVIFVIEQGGGEKYGKKISKFLCWLFCLIIIRVYAELGKWVTRWSSQPVLCILRWWIDIFCCQVLDGRDTNWFLARVNSKAALNNWVFEV